MTYSGHIANATAADWLATLIKLIVQRLALAEDIAAGKFLTGQPIDDPVREREILDSVARVIHDAGPYREIVVQFLRDQIEASKVIQRGLYQRWHGYPEELPAVRRSLAGEIRPKIDRITMRMLRQLMYMNELPNLEWAHIGAMFDDQFTAQPFIQHLPGLRQKAVIIALRSLVRGYQPGGPGSGGT